MFADGSFAEFKRRTIFLAVVVLLVLFVLNYASILILLFASILAASVFAGLSDALAGRTGMRFGIALLLVVAGLAIVFAVLMALIGVPFVLQVEELAESLTSAYQGLEERLARSPTFQWIAEALPSSKEEEWINKALSGPIFGFFSGVVGALTSVVLILFIALYLAVNRRLYFRGLLHLFPKERQSRFEEILRILGRSLQYWMLGRILSMAVVGVLTGVGLWIAGIPMVLSLAVIAGLFAFVPVVGPIVASVPGILLGLAQSTSTGLLVAGIYLLVQTLESYLITPLIARRVVSLPPVLLLASQAVFATLVGIPGILFAAPMTLVIIILVQRLYVHDALGHEIEAIGKEPATAE